MTGEKISNEINMQQGKTEGASRLSFEPIVDRGGQQCLPVHGADRDKRKNDFWHPLVGVLFFAQRRPSEICQQADGRKRRTSRRRNLPLLIFIFKFLEKIGGLIMEIIKESIQKQKYLQMTWRIMQGTAFS